VGSLSQSHSRASIEPSPLPAPFVRCEEFDSDCNSAARPIVREKTLPEQVAGYFNLEVAETVSTTSLKTSQIAVTRLSGSSGSGMSSPMPAGKAYLVVLQLQDSAGNELWKAGHLNSTVPFLDRSLIISHLREELALNLQGPFDFLLLHIPECVFDELADTHGTPRIDGLRSESEAHDTTLHYLGRALLGAMENTPEASGKFFDHMAFAICLRLAQRYGVQRPRGGALSPTQTRLAKDMLAADLIEQPNLDLIANACGMPVGRFVRSFREVTGLPPHRWLRSFRVDRAKQLLCGSSLSLAQIAYECGFSDQSHFTRVFTAAVRETPAAWRRAQRR